MRYVQLRAFHHVALCGGFSRAAKMLNLTQPAISDQVRKLETEYDVRLFDRGKRQVTLTPTGEKLFEVTLRMFEVEGRAVELLAESRSIKTGKLNIIADSAHHVTEILAEFRRKYPSVFVSLRVGNSKTVTEMLTSYDADIGILGEVPIGREYKIINLRSTPIIAFALVESEMGKRSSISMREFAALPMAVREPGSKTRAKFEDFAKRSGIKPRIAIEAEGREAVSEIVAAGDCIGVVSEAEFGNDPRFVRIPIEDADIMMDEALICLRERQDSRLIRTFMEVAQSVVGEPRSAQSDANPGFC